MPTVLSLFSGAGGFDCGLAAAGFSTLLSIDSDHSCAQTLKANEGALTVIEGDVGASTFQNSIKNLPAIDLLCAGPPCQPFSKSANWHSGGPKGFEDPRATTLEYLMRVVERTGPRAVLIENVPGFARKFGGLDWLRAAFHNVNSKLGTRYELSHAIIDAADYGVPQRRRRLVAVADRKGRRFNFPEALTQNSPRTAWDAVWDLEPVDVTPLVVRGRWANLLPSIPAGENYLWHTDRGGGLRLFGYRTRYWSFLLKLSPQAPSWTLSAQPAQTAGPFHWGNRRLSLSEMLRLQSFPKNWKVCGSYPDHVRQLGNAFPPLLAEILGRELRSQLLETQCPATTPYSLWLPRAETPAPICDVERVADEYLSLVDVHPAHPGHGLGPGAVRRAA